jgi:hypothetical protein
MYMVGIPVSEPESYSDTTMHTCDLFGRSINTARLVRHWYKIQHL